MGTARAGCIVSANPRSVAGPATGKISRARNTGALATPNLPRQGRVTRMACSARCRSRHEVKGRGQ